jgi:hypothetical protein
MDSRTEYGIEVAPHFTGAYLLWNAVNPQTSWSLGFTGLQEINWSAAARCVTVQPGTGGGRPSKQAEHPFHAGD